MKILFFTQHFNLPDEPGFSRPYQFAKRWSENGNEVTIIASTYNYHAGKTQDKYAKRLFFIDYIDRIKVIRIGLKGYSLKYWILFSIIGTIISLFLKRRDIIFASSKPLTVGFPALIISWLWQKPFLLEVRDCYSKSFLQQDKTFYILEKILYKRAKKIIGVSKVICADIIKKGRTSEDIMHIPHGVDDWILNESHHPLSSHEDRNGKFKCVLSAAIMRDNEIDFEAFIGAAELLKNEPDVHFFVIGAGNYAEELASRGLKNITFLGALSKRMAVDYINSADLCILPLKEKLKNTYIDWVMPVKLFDYFGCARPVAAIAPQQEIREIITKAQGGIAVDSNTAKSLADAILYIRSFTKEKRLLMGKKGFEYAKAFHSLAHLADEVELIMKNL